MSSPGPAVPPPDLRIVLFGTFGVHVSSSNAVTGWRLRKAKALVTLLAVSPAHRIRRDRLAEILWPGRSGASSTNNLHQALHSARRALIAAGAPADVLVIHGGVVELNGEVWIDADAYEAAARRALGLGTPDALQAAVALWAGEPLSEDAYEEWAQPIRDRLFEFHAELVARTATVLIDVGEAANAVDLLAPMAEQRRYDEPLQRTLIRALSAAGRRVEAVAALDRMRTALSEGLGVGLGAETTRFVREVFGMEAPGSRVPNNMPAPVSSLIGRRRELADLDAALDRSRVLTITGTGGVGKTRLAVELARARSRTGQHTDGVWLVALAGVTDPAQVVPALASALHLRLDSTSSPMAAVVRQLGDQQVLVLLDNCEHVLSTCARLIETALAGCPGLTVVATSREPLRVTGELTWRTPSLGLPAAGEHDPARLAGAAAVQLFVERAGSARPGFVVTADNAGSVARVCRGLDGIPLAVELAAARMAHLTPAELADRLGDALALLSRRTAGPPDRTQTIAATLEWSYRLLAEEERSFFGRLAVFAGGFDLEAALAVCPAAGGVVELLSALIDKSLVIADTGGSAARFTLLEVVRQYAASVRTEGQQAESRRRHRDHYIASAARHDPDAGPVVGQPGTWFDVEHSNLEAALASVADDDPAQGLVLATCMFRFWLARGLVAEASLWLERLLSASPAPSFARARALFGTAVTRHRSGHLETLAAIGSEIVSIHDAVGDEVSGAAARHEAALLTLMSGDWPRAERMNDQVVAATPRIPSVRSSALHMAAIMALRRDDLSYGRDLLTASGEALEAVERTSPPFFFPIGVGWLIHRHDGLPLPILEDSLFPGWRVGAVQAEAGLLVSRSVHARVSGDLDAATRLIGEAGWHFRSVGDRFGEGVALNQNAHVLRWSGDPAARSLFEQAATIREGFSDHRGAAIARCGITLCDAAAGRAGPARRQALRLQEVLQRASDRPLAILGATNLAVVDVLLGDLPAALRHLDEVLSSQARPGGLTSTGWTSIGWPLLLKAHLSRRLGLPDHGAAAQARTIFNLGPEPRGLAALDELTAG